MIRNLYIKDFALIESSRVDFSDGLNVIIGETGSGKSMLIEALIIAFGGRASSDLIRNNASKAVIEIEISTQNQKIIDLLNENEIEFSGETIIIRREISTKGSTRNFIGDSPVNLSLIKQLGDLFIDFHGQHDHQSLLNAANHPEIFDKSAGLYEKLESYSLQFNKLKDKISDYKQLLNKERNLKDRAEIQKFKLDEISKVNPNENEDEILESELKLLENSETLYSLSSELYSDLYGSEESVWNGLSKTLNLLGQLEKIDDSFAEYLKELNSSLISIKEIAYFSNDYKSSIEFNPQRIEEIRQRLMQLRGLQKKFGSIAEIINLRNELQEDLKLIENFDEKKSALESEIKALKIDVLKIGLEIENQRRNYAPDFSSQIVDSLANLGINNSVFNPLITRQYAESVKLSDFSTALDGQIVELLPDGINQIEFYISTNLGESVKPLKQVASGGEVSRIMLSIKNILADKDNIASLVFDEIDTGVSGRIAQMVGQSMKNLAKYHQIIAISHLPQIAAVADVCLLVEKFETDSKTFSEVRLLSDKEKVVEIAKMMSGEEISEASLNNAFVLINNS
ncbi:MAG: DNA repair protein RecN [Candidatus Kapabacteria bacterium]|nr:DNA repair protein RecN [Candidatus Kapabacteria bacterium]